ncbi:MAG: hypothetical protein V3575_00995 [Candidatus Absconditabacteria bacterium]
MNIGIDLDEVLCEFLDGVLRFHNDIYGTNLVKEHFTSYMFWNHWGGTKQQAIDKVLDFYKSEYYSNLEIVPYSQKILTELSIHHSLYLITSRQNVVKESTIQRLNKNYLNCFKGFYFTNAYSNSGSESKKSIYCDKLKIDLMIEDSVEHALDCSLSSNKVLLLDKPWNQDFFDKDNKISRVNDWLEIKSYIENISTGINI